MSIHTPYPIIAKLCSKANLQTVLVVPFVLQIVGMVGLVGYLSFKNGQGAVNDVASQFRREISDRTADQIRTYLKTPHLINATNADAVRLGQLDIKNPQGLQRHFLKQIQVFTSLSKFQGVLSSALSLAAINNFLKNLTSRFYGANSRQ